jgi:DNA-binding XRE family transcriptional regulator
MNVINSKKLGKKLKEARIKAVYSRAMVANILEISEGAIRNFENDSRMPKLNAIIAVCGVYRIKLNELVIYSQK